LSFLPGEQYSSQVALRSPDKKFDALGGQ